MKDLTKYHSHWEIVKYASEKDFAERKPYQRDDIEGNMVLDDGTNFLWKILCGGQETADALFDHDHAFIGVGDSSMVETHNQTDLQGVSQSFKGMETAYPEYGTDRQVTFYAVFGALEGNHPWNEFCLTNYDHSSGTSGIVFNRKVSAKGTKTSGDVWEVKLILTLAE